MLPSMILTVFTISFCWFVLALAGYTMWNLTWFLSDHRGQRGLLTQSYKELAFSLCIDLILLILFTLQHSCWKTNDIGNYLSKYRISRTVARSIYVLFTCMVLQLLTVYWMPATSFTLWSFDTSRDWLWWLLSVIHFLSWACVYGGSVLLDLPELIGIKQVYYYYINVPESSDLKSAELQRLYSHKRHPSFIGFLAIVWATPVMSLDRLLLAIVITAYTATAWEPTVDDKRYHKHQLTQKKLQVEYSARREQLSRSYQYSRYDYDS